MSPGNAADSPLERRQLANDDAPGANAADVPARPLVKALCDVCNTFTPAAMCERFTPADVCRLAMVAERTESAIADGMRQILEKLDHVIRQTAQGSPRRSTRSRDARKRPRKRITRKEHEAVEAVQRHDGNVSAAAAELQVTRQALAERFRNATAKLEEMGLIRMPARPLRQAARTMRLQADRRGSVDVEDHRASRPDVEDGT